MITALATGAGPAERDYRMTVRGAPASTVALRANVPQGWIVAFCTPSVCAPRHVVVRVPQSGKSTIALHIYRIRDDAARRDTVVINDDRGGSLTLPISF